MFAAFTDPPYWMRTVAPASAPRRSAPRSVRTSRAHRLRVVRRRGAARADRPDRLVGDDHRRHLLARSTPASPARTWPTHLCLGVARLALLERLADAHDRRHAVREHRLDLAVDQLVGLAEQLAALGVPDDHVRARRAWRASPGDTSPVNAPFSSQWQCCAPSAIGASWSDSSAVCTVRMSVNGGCTDTSTAS